jgi:hypothetical protein
MTFSSRAAPVFGVFVFLFVTAGAAGADGQLTVSDVSPSPGSAITVTSTGWSTGREVTIALSGTKAALARVVADANGAVSARITVPADVMLDVNVLSATGTAASGVPQQIVKPLTVHPVGPEPAPTRPWGLVLALGGIAGALLIVSVLTAKPAGRLAAS